MIIGYARVWTDGLTLDSQIEHLTRAGCSKIFSEAAGGAKTQRKELRRCIAALKAGDVFIVVRLDRLARSTRDLLNVLAEVSARGAAFRSLADGWADTTMAHGRLMLTIPGGSPSSGAISFALAQGKGRTRAKAKGIKFGRKPKLTIG